MALNETVVDDVANSNFKTVAGQPSLTANNAAQLGNLALGNAVSFQQGMNGVFMAITAKMAELLATIDPAEALGTSVLGQQAAKVAQSTPPVTT